MQWIRWKINNLSSRTGQSENRRQELWNYPGKVIEQRRENEKEWRKPTGFKEYCQRTNLWIISVLEGDERTEGLFKEIVAENFQNLGRD